MQRYVLLEATNYYSNMRQIMALEPASMCLWQSILIILLLVTVCNTIYHVSPGFDPPIVHLHEVLTSFASRGQLTVELFAPLSTIICSSPNGLMVLQIACYMAWTSVGDAFLRMLQAHRIVVVSNNLKWIALLALMVGMNWFSSPLAHKNFLSLVQ